MKNKFIKSTGLTLLTMIALITTGCSQNETYNEDPNLVDQVVDAVDSAEKADTPSAESTQANMEPQENKVSEVNSQDPDTVNYRLIEVDGGNTSGSREPNVIVNIGHGNGREYWAYTNEHGQLVRVTAKEIILQNDKTEDVSSSGRYYSAMADVPGVGEQYGMDRGHVLADSLGGVSNAYNITPQEATLNRHGDQAYMERNIREAGGATDFEAIITYPNTETQTPSEYKMTYTIKGNTVVDEFANGNPDKANADLGLTKPAEDAQTKYSQVETAETKASQVEKAEVKTAEVETAPAQSDNSNVENTGNVSEGDTAAVDTNGNGQITIAEAEKAGFSMPIYKGHWLYDHMQDNNSNGVVGE